MKDWKEMLFESKVEDLTPKAKSMIKTINNDQKVLKTRIVNTTMKGKKMKVLEIYVKNRKSNNPYGLETFSGENGEGYLFYLDKEFVHEAKKNVDEVGEIKKFTVAMSDVMSALDKLKNSESEAIAKESKKIYEMVVKVWKSSDKPLRAYGRDNYKKGE